MLLADALEGLAALAVGGLDLVMMIDARQARRQRLAHRLAFGPGWCYRWLLVFLGGAVFQRRVGQDLIGTLTLSLLDLACDSCRCCDPVRRLPGDVP